MSTRSNHLLPLFACLGFGLAGCGEPGARVSLRFGDARNTGSSVSSALYTGPSLDQVGMRFIGITMWPGLDTAGLPGGNASHLFVNPACAGDVDTDQCTLAGDEVAGVTLHSISDYFDFTDTIKANAAIGGQTQFVQTGIYRYISMQFCTGTPTQPNIRYQFQGGTERAFALGHCGMTMPIESPLTVNDGDVIEVTMTYDWATWINAGDSDVRCDLDPNVQPRPTGNDGAGWCLDNIGFTVTAAHPEQP